MPAQRSPAPLALPDAEPPLPAPGEATPAVAARFPEPAVDFATPAFTPRRTAFTSNAELHDALRAIVSGGRPPGGSIELLALGESAAGTPIEALSFSRAATPSGGAADEPPRRPSVVLLGGQHGDEPAAAEALLVFAQMLAGGRYDRVLERIDVVMVPRANPDGAEAGRRDLSSGIDLDRDHLLLRSAEARALATLVERIQPLLVVDLQEYAVTKLFEAKFGGVQRADALVQYATVANLPRFVTKAAEEWFREPLVRTLAAAGTTTDWLHTVSADPDDRTVAMGGVGTGSARNVFGLYNAASLVVASRGGGLGRVDLKRRVQTQVLALDALLRNAATRGSDLVKLRQFVDRDVASLACQGEAVVEAEPTPSEYGLQLLDPQTGATRRVTVAWQSSLELRALRSRPRPCGYWLGPDQGDAVARLETLGIAVQRLDEAGEVRGETWRESATESRGGSAGSGGVGAGGARMRAQTQPALLDLAPGGFYVTLEQPLANLAIAALEPEAPGSLVAERVVALASVARVMARPSMRMSGNH